MEDIADTHPIFLLKQERAEEKEMIGPFEILFDRFYHEGHVWVKPVGGVVQIGIDDFTRQILGVVSDLKLPSYLTALEAEDNLFEIFGNEKTLRMFSPIDGIIVDINSDILDNPALTGVSPYDRGWILTVEPVDMLQVSKDLLSGRSAKEWLKFESHKFSELTRKETEQDIRPGKTIPKDFAKTVTKETWKKVQKTFFTKKRKKKKVKLYRLADLH
jgi:glycine cleavage system H protein